MYIPPGFNTVTPYFFVDDAETFVRFLVLGLGGTETCRTMRPNGLIQNVQVKLGTSTVMVSEATERYKPMAAAYYLYVEDADASMQRALKHGAMLETLTPLAPATLGTIMTGYPTIGDNSFKRCEWTIRTGSITSWLKRRPID